MTWFDRPILAVETSCDETSAAVIHGREVLSNVVSSQIELHKKWGGIVPEAAARAHVEAILPVIEEALVVPMDEIGGIAVTNRPGLVGALSVGVTFAKGLAYARKLPLIGVHHLEGHILSTFAQGTPPFPHVCLIVSGGHTELVMVKGLGQYEIIGETRDDAAGEAFDKSARLLGLGYPGGYAIQELARQGKPRYSLPRGLSGDTLDFSFSGFKTAVLRLTQNEPDLNRADAAASIEETITDVLTERALRACDHFEASALSLVGGVAANLKLRSKLADACDRIDLPFFVPPLSLTTDNAAMIGIAGSWRLAASERSGWDLDCLSSASL